MDKLQDIISAFTSGDDERAEAAAMTLSSHGAEGQAALEGLTSDPDPDRRWWGVRALAEMGSDDAIPLLIQALNDEDPAVRGCAARGLQGHNSEGALHALVAALADDDSLVARLAGNALVGSGATAVPALLGALDGGSYKSQVEGTRALALIGDQRSIPALFEALDSDSTLIEYWANEGLERMGVGMTFFNP